uniref:(northern house mosquito) hypothetical protein n=1 Tax=Culex pipiens TaxID=7175 RepID=A0A8D8B5V9_CULPI
MEASASTIIWKEGGKDRIGFGLNGSAFRDDFRHNLCRSHCLFDMFVSLLNERSNHFLLLVIWDLLSSFTTSATETGASTGVGESTAATSAQLSRLFQGSLRY